MPDLMPGGTNIQPLGHREYGLQAPGMGERLRVTTEPGAMRTLAVAVGINQVDSTRRGADIRLALTRPSLCPTLTGAATRGAAPQVDRMGVARTTLQRSEES